MFLVESDVKAISAPGDTAAGSRLLRGYDAVEPWRGGREDRVNDLEGLRGGLGGNIGQF